MVKQSCECHEQSVRWPENCAPQRCSRSHKQRHEKIHEKRIGQRHAGEFRVLRRKVAAKSKPARDGDMKREIANVRVKSREYAGSIFVQGAIADEPEHNGACKVKRRNSPSRVARAYKRLMEVRFDAFPDRSIKQQQPG